MLGPVLAFAATLLLMTGLRALAPVVGLIDRPGGRKRHEGEVPVIGGLAIFGGSLMGSMLLPEAVQMPVSFVMCAALLVAVGAADDRFDVSAWVRLGAQLTTALIMVGTEGLVIQELGAGNGANTFNLGPFAASFTVLAVVAAINAYNMIDGLDGLSGGLGLVAILSLLMVAHGGPLAGAAPILAMIAATIGAFLPFNVPVGINRQMRCFMGDAGSTLIGFTVAWFGIQLSQGNQPQVQPITILWFTAVPLLELAVSFCRRLAAGRSPLAADADHFHHKLMRAGLSVPGTCVTLVGLAAIFAATGLFLEHVEAPSLTSLALLIMMSAGVIRALLKAHSWAGALPAWMTQRRPSAWTRPIPPPPVLEAHVRSPQ
ncbi:hypothetical protein [Povalibacter sp.]|uniref:hypothetical protein n=1 Tax=Povalibacter sp. TaxID=1962978 RepID=UPI002F3F6429